MSDPAASDSSVTRNAGRADWLANRNTALLVATGMATLGGLLAAFILGNSLTRAREADRYVTVRGLAEKDVVADLAGWTVTYAASASDLAAAQQDIDADTAAIQRYFTGLGFAPDTLVPSGVNVSSFIENGVPRITITQRLQFRSTDVARAQRAVARQFDLVRAGVSLVEGSNMTYTFTKLNDIKSEMVAQATKDARQVAEQFARDSGAEVGAIRRASQGYFEIQARDGVDGGYGVSDSPDKKVRVVTTVEYYLE